MYRRNFLLGLAASTPAPALAREPISAPALAHNQEHTPQRFSVRDDGRPHDSNSDRLRDWLLAAAQEGRRAIVPGGRTYIVGDPVVVPIERPLDIDMHAGAIIKGDAGAGEVIRIRSANATTRPSLRFVGHGVIDSSGRKYVASVASGTGLVLTRLGEVTVSDLTFQGRRGYGDSGIATELCSSMLLSGLRLYEHSDLGIYITGGGLASNADDWGDVQVVNCIFKGCATAVSARRGVQRVIMSGNIIRDGDNGLQIAEAASNGLWLPPGRETIIANNIGQNLKFGLVDMRVAAPGSMIVNNMIVDWAQGSDRSAIGVLGTRHVQVKGNNMVMLKGSGNAAAAITVGDYRDQGGVFHLSEDNFIAGNSITTASVGIRDISRNKKNQIGPNDMIGVAKPYEGVSNVRELKRRR